MVVGRHPRPGSTNLTTNRNVEQIPTRTELVQCIDLGDGLLRNSTLRDADGDEKMDCDSVSGELDEALSLIADARAAKVVQLLFTFLASVAMVSMLNYLAF